MEETTAAMGKCAGVHMTYLGHVRPLPEELVHIFGLRLEMREGLKLSTTYLKPL